MILLVAVLLRLPLLTARCFSDVGPNLPRADWQQQKGTHDGVPRDLIMGTHNGVPRDLAMGTHDGVRRDLAINDTRLFNLFMTKPPHCLRNDVCYRLS